MAAAATTAAAVRPTLSLSPELERAILAAIIRGQVGLDVVTEAELSKLGRMVYRAVGLLSRDASPPYSLATVELAATDVLGAPRHDIRQYLREVAAGASASAESVLRRVRDKQLLVEVINTASRQLGQGTLDVGAILRTVLASSVDGGGAGRVVPIAERIRDGLPDPPEGIPITSLPTMTRVTGGLYGVWVVAGEPKTGKTALAWQITLDVGRRVPVIYNDLENGFPVLMDRTRQIFGADLDAIRRATARVYYVDNARDLDWHLTAVPPPAVVVVDSLQKLPTSDEHRRQGLDRWIHRLETLKRRGYHVLLISEVSRAAYGGEPTIAAGKDTGEIEYAADLEVQLVPTHPGSVAAYIVANRHRKHRGYVCRLRRERGWIWREIDEVVSEENDDGLEGGDGD